LLIYHLWAVAILPLAFQARGPFGNSEIVATGVVPVQTYAEFFYLNRGYAFFAPNPGPSHLIEAAYTDLSGKRVEEVYPDRQRSWSRLYYHRHFMLSEYLYEIYQPPGPPIELERLDPTEARVWAGLRARYEYVRQSYVEHLKSVYGNANDLAIRRLEHRIPSFIEMADAPVSLTDPRFYGVLTDQPIPWSPEETPTGPPEVIPVTVASEEAASLEADVQTLPSKVTE
jgi:hypothetical protein